MRLVSAGEGSIGWVAGALRALWSRTTSIRRALVHRGTCEAPTPRRTLVGVGTLDGCFRRYLLWTWQLRLCFIKYGLFTVT